METGSGSCLSDRNIKIVFVCALSTDVLGGALAGAISGYLGYRFIQTIFYRIKTKEGGCAKSEE